jgi:hypothetical protein
VSPRTDVMAAGQLKHLKEQVRAEAHQRHRQLRQTQGRQQRHNAVVVRRESNKAACESERE